LRLFLGCNKQLVIDLMEGCGPTNGTQYGKLFNEKDLSDDEAVQNDDVLSMLDIFIDDQILLEGNIDEGALLSDFFEGLGDLDGSAALGSFGENAEFGMATLDDFVGCDDLDFVELIGLDYEIVLAECYQH